MYITAQRVVSAKGQRGVNVYEYLHGPQTWTLPLPRQLLPENEPGRLNRSWKDVPPPGNAVISYLDVVVPDNVPRDEVARWLIALKQSIRAEAVPREYTVGPLWVRFGIARPGVPPQTELAALAAHILLRAFQPGA
jgi:hypothetical protein